MFESRHRERSRSIESRRLVVVVRYRPRLWCAEFDDGIERNGRDLAVYARNSGEQSGRKRRPRVVELQSWVAVLMQTQFEDVDDRVVVVVVDDDLRSTIVR